MNDVALHGGWGPGEVWVFALALVAAGYLTGLAWVAWRARLLRRRIRLVLGGKAGTTGDGQQPAFGTALGSRLPTGRSGARTGRGKWAASGRVRAGAATTGTGALAALLVEGAPGWCAGAAVAYGVWRWLSRRTAVRDSAQGESEARVAAGQLPLTAELLAACLAAGSTPGQAADAVGRSVGGPLGIRLAHAAKELQLGAEPRAVWARFTSLPGGRAFARCMERAGAGGVPAVEPVTRLAAELRARQARAATTGARRAAVLVTGPLGLCFLPAFLAVGVAPVVMGLARSLT